MYDLRFHTVARQLHCKGNVVISVHYVLLLFHLEIKPLLSPEVQKYCMYAH